MAKYYIALFLIMGAVLFYIFLEDPCNNILRADFSEKFPDYKILDSVSGEGSPDNVQCHIYYEKPDSKQVYKDTWSYRNSESGWRFSEVIETENTEQMP